MAVKAARKPRKLRVQGEHAIFGPCLLVERRTTPSGNDIFLAEFPDKSERTLLADSRFWVTPAAQLKAIPIKTKSPVAEADEKPEIENAHVDEDFESEVAA
jgi:hypothetical protein